MTNRKRENEKKWQNNNALLSEPMRSGSRAHVNLLARISEKLANARL